MELPAKHFCFLSVHFLLLQCTVWKGEWRHQRCLPILLSPFLIATVCVMWIFLQKKCMFSDWFPGRIISLWSRFLLCLITFEIVQLYLIAATISRHSVSICATWKQGLCRSERSPSLCRTADKEILPCGPGSMGKAHGDIVVSLFGGFFFSPYKGLYSVFCWSVTLLKPAESQSPRFRKCFPMAALWDSLGAGRELCSCWQQFRPGSSLGRTRACAKTYYGKAASSSYSRSERLGDVDLCLLQTWHQWNPQKIPQRHAYRGMKSLHFCWVSWLSSASQPFYGVPHCTQKSCFYIMNGHCNINQLSVQEHRIQEGSRFLSCVFGLHSTNLFF